MKIAYEKHPVSPERKAELIAQGFKIVDARFKPADAATVAPAFAEAEPAEDDRPSFPPRRGRSRKGADE